MTLMLKTVLRDHEITHEQLAGDVGLSRPALSGLLNHGRWPVTTDRRALRDAITRFLQARGIETSRVFTKAAAPRANAAPPVSRPTAKPEDQEDQMLLRKQTLSQAARKAFQLSTDPFAVVTRPEDVFMSPDIRYVREALHGITRHGGFLAVVGESGAGKTTLREELLERLSRESARAIIAQPYVLASEDSDEKGRKLQSQHIAESILAAVAPLEKAKSSLDARFRQLHRVLIESARAGHQHVLIIEEAHSLPIPTLRALKRYIELKDGMRPLLSIILFGQPELMLKLSEHDPRVREIVQRLEVVELPPLDAQLEPYIKHRFERAGVPLQRVFEAGAIEALRTRLSPNDKGQNRGSLLFPLVIHNVLTAALNAAADIGVERISADIIKGV